MVSTRGWALRRRIQYIVGIALFLFVVLGGAYMRTLYQPPTCFDGDHNGQERGIDCGGTCVRICAADVVQPVAQWARAFKITDGQYNAVAYVENRNTIAGAPEMYYTFKLFDDAGLIAERKGSTVFPPDSVNPIFEGRIQTGTRVPTRTFIEIEEPAMWLPAESVRSQFEIKSRSLTHADTMPRLDVEIENTNVERVRDVEVIATIFDVSKNALTASQTVVPVMSARETRKIVFTWPEPIATTVRSCELPTDVVLAIDLSGSMNNDGGTPPEPVTSVLAAATEFVNRLGTKDQAAVVTYATEATLESPLSSNRVATGRLIQNLRIAPESEQGSTNTGDAIIKATAELQSNRHNTNARKVAVLLTDGLANEPEIRPEAYALEAAAKLKAIDTEVYVIGLGDDVNESFLRSVASGDAYYYRAVSADTINAIYQEITGSICENGVATIEIIPKMPITFKAVQ
ncbi:MAG: VWA domain-containing protein [Candidatus Pacebacteria bacterium]|nr:VWA domain-containing protein [Candidatus Paceibacterota bacterium]